MKTLYNTLLVISLALLSCKGKSPEIYQIHYKTTTTFLQKDNGLTRLYSVEKFDSIGKSIELITYKDDLISTIKKHFYDSLNRPIKTFWMNSEGSSLILYFMNYNSKSLLIKDSTIFDNYISIGYYGYDSKDRLIRRKSITSRFKTIDTRIQDYYYENDSLCKIYFSDDITDKYLRNSFEYYPNFKIENTFNYLFSRSKTDILYKGKEISEVEKDTTFYDNGLITREIKSNLDIRYYYNSNKNLVKKKVINYCTGDVIYSGYPICERLIYTYKYEE